MTAFLTWLVNIVLSMLFDRATKELTAHENKVTEDKLNGVIDDANVAKYQAAKDRAAKIAAAQSLLNRTP